MVEKKYLSVKKEIEVFIDLIKLNLLEPRNNPNVTKK